MDWAVELFGWFNYYLKDIGEEPEPMVQIQTNDGRWHVEETWPPEDALTLLQDLESDWSGASGTVNGFGSSVTMTSPVLKMKHIFPVSQPFTWTFQLRCVTEDKFLQHCTTMMRIYGLDTQPWTFDTGMGDTMQNRPHQPAVTPCSWNSTLSM